LAASICFLALFQVSRASAAPPDFSGKWVLDASKSEITSGDSIEITIQNQSGKIAFDRVLKESNGRQSHSSFTCAPDGTWCDFSEDGEKAKVTLWYSGSALIIAKTGGSSKDATTERRMELSPDGKTLTVELTNYSGSGKAEKLVFSKQ
jgi:hypothetical protein